MKVLNSSGIIVCILLLLWSCKTDNLETINRPVVQSPEQNGKKEKKDENPDKTAIWTPEQAARHQRILTKLTRTSKSFTTNKVNNTYADGALQGTWKVRGPKNMPGAFKFVEMLDETDFIYGVTHNHYAGEYNSKSYIFKGTVYNPQKGTGGDDFELLTANWPNRYQNLFAFQINGITRLVAHIENGPLYYSDDEGSTWVMSDGLPTANTSSAINRQDSHTIYVTDNKAIYKSIDFGVSFSLLQDFGDTKGSFLYTPRYSNQPNADSVYLGRGGTFYTLNTAQTQFVSNGSYIANHGSKALSIGGDSRKLYVTENKKYWVSTDGGQSWTEKFPKGNYYNSVGVMSPGKFLAINPENADVSVAGYAHPTISTDGLNTTFRDPAGWGRYQNGTNLSTEAYYNRIRFNYHPDIQSSHFFYNSSGDLLSAHCTDGGIFVSYKVWKDLPAVGAGYDNSGYANAHFININVLNTVCPLIYRDNVFTGSANPDHINYSTQDQGSGSIIPGTSGETLDFYQAIGGDGPGLDSYDGENVWRWNRQGDKVYAPVKVYKSNGAFQSIGQINSQFSSSPTIDFTKNTANGWTQSFIDHDQPDKRIWILARNLDRATVNGSGLQGHTVDVGTNQVAALAQGWENPDKLWMLQDGKVFISTDRGTNFGSAVATPFDQTSSGRGDIGSGVVLPTNDDWILFCGPSNNNVGSILSKDGGNTWINVTGDFPADSDAQTGGMIVTPDGKFVFAGTDVGPYVFDVSQEKWFSIAEGIGFFNAMDVDYISTANAVRFGSWGSGVLDFTIDETVTVQTAFADHIIPGVIQAEDFDNGGQDLAYNDTDASNNGGVGRLNEGVDVENTTDIGGGANIGYIKNGEWLEYTIADIEPGIYDIILRVASNNDNVKSLKVSLGTQDLGTASIGNTGGWQSWQDIVLSDVEINSNNADQILRLDIVGGNFNINWIEFGFDSLSTNDFDLEDIIISPNPVQHTLFLNGIRNNHNFVVIDLSGREVAKYEVNSDQTEIPVNHLKPGLYLLKDQTNSDFYYKFIKQ